MRLLKIATSAVLAASLSVNLLIDYGYPFLSSEVLVIALSFAIIGGAFGALTANSFLYSYYSAILIYFFVEIYYFNWQLWQMLTSVIMLFGLVFILRNSGTKFLPYLLIFAGFFSFSAVLKPQQPILAISGSRQDSTLKQDQSVLHIVLDEMASPYASEFPPAPGHPAGSLLEDLAAKDFHVEAQAYAIDTMTVRSLSAIVALDQERTEFQIFPPGSRIAFKPADNIYMKRFDDLGYEVAVIQSNFIDYCSDLQSVVCETYSRVGHAESFLSASLGERMKFAFSIVNESMKSNTRTGVPLYSAVTNLIDDKDPFLDSYVHFRPFISHELMQREVTQRVGSIERGELHYIHLLIPHFPYVYDQNCALRPSTEWGYPDRHSPTHDSAESYAKYWDQVACVKKTLFEILNLTADKDFLTTIIHGDHGARILWRTENETLNDARKTFVAVRSANHQPGLQTEPVNLQAFVIEVIDSFLR